MTSREFFTAIIEGNINAEIVEFAIAQIEKMNKHNKSRSSSPSKTQIANEPIKAAIVEYLTREGEFKTSTEIGEALEISTSKAGALCRQLRDDGVLSEEEVKIKGVGKRKVYKVAPTDAEEVEEVAE